MKSRNTRRHTGQSSSSGPVWRKTAKLRCRNFATKPTWRSKAAKADGFADYAFYDGELRSRLLEEQFIREQMHTALAERQFVVYLQPKVEMSSGRIVGAEALARWRHPRAGG